MIRAITKEDIPECVNVIRTSFQTVAEEFDITPENSPHFTAFATNEAKVLRKWYEDHGFTHTCTKKFDFFSFTAGYMEKEL